MPSPMTNAVPISFASQGNNLSRVMWPWEIARVVKVLDCKPTFPEIAQDNGRNPIRS